MKNVSSGILAAQDADETPIFWVVFRPKPRSVLRNRQGIPRLSGVSSRAHEGGTRGGEASLRARSNPQQTTTDRGGNHCRRPSCALIPAHYYTRGITFRRPYVNSLISTVNSIYNGSRFEDLGLE